MFYYSKRDIIYLFVFFILLVTACLFQVFYFNKDINYMNLVRIIVLMLVLFKIKSSAYINNLKKNINNNEVNDKLYKEIEKQNKCIVTKTKKLENDLLLAVINVDKNDFQLSVEILKDTINKNSSKSKKNSLLRIVAYSNLSSLYFYNNDIYNLRKCYQETKIITNNLDISNSSSLIYIYQLINIIDGDIYKAKHYFEELLSNNKTNNANNINVGIILYIINQKLKLDNKELFNYLDTTKLNKDTLYQLNSLPVTVSSNNIKDENVEYKNTNPEVYENKKIVKHKSVKQRVIFLIVILIITGIAFMGFNTLYYDLMPQRDYVENTKFKYLTEDTFKVDKSGVYLIYYKPQKILFGDKEVLALFNKEQIDSLSVTIKDSNNKSVELKHSGWINSVSLLKCRVKQPMLYSFKISQPGNYKIESKGLTVKDSYLYIKDVTYDYHVYIMSRIEKVVLIVIFVLYIIKVRTNTLEEYIN